MIAYETMIMSSNDSKAYLIIKIHIIKKNYLNLLPKIRNRNVLLKISENLSFKTFSFFPPPLPFLNSFKCLYLYHSLIRKVDKSKSSTS